MRGTKIQQNLKGGTSMKGVQTKFHYILKIVAKCGNPKLLGEEMSVIQWHIIWTLEIVLLRVRVVWIHQVKFKLATRFHLQYPSTG